MAKVWVQFWLYHGFLTVVLGQRLNISGLIWTKNASKVPITWRSFWTSGVNRSCLLLIAKRTWKVIWKLGNRTPCRTQYSPQPKGILHPPHGTQQMAQPARRAPPGLHSHSEVGAAHWGPRSHHIPLLSHTGLSAPAL